MNDQTSIELMDIVPLVEHSNFIKPLRVHYKQSGKLLTWDCIKKHDSVAILIFNKTRNVFVFVRQFRPSVFLSIHQLDDKSKNIADINKQMNSKAGYTIELCAGIIDKEGLSPQEIAREEIIEETGYSPTLESVQFITSHITSVGTGASIQYLYYCEVEDSMRVSQGGGIENESIEIIEMTIEEARKHMLEPDHSTGMARTADFRFALCWFIYEKYPLLETAS
ncbi:hypothetical protein RDWZM_008020 [Blomia tropicalis]|uniref:Uridine diphosphate glucose pyrophosphatase NUDT14 n=1 Tax=Blomia tropicalis TaxID=40697 RepID=A0A9Q0RIH5_BLOTA|nr:hypothetical protein RDWZM_008020 [Blomia tropicalis]